MLEIRVIKKDELLVIIIYIIDYKKTDNKIFSVLFFIHYLMYIRRT